MADKIEKKIISNVKKTELKKLEDDNDKIHRQNINSERLIENVSKAKPGCIIKFNYTGKKSHDPQPLILLLNNNYSGKTHGLALRKLSTIETTQLAKIVRETWWDKLKNVFVKNTTDMSDPYKFYHSVLKSFLRNRVGSDSCYRVYDISKITGVRIIDYKFNKEIDNEIKTKFI